MTTGAASAGTARRREIEQALDRIERSGFVLAKDPVGIIRRERRSH